MLLSLSLSLCVYVQMLVCVALYNRRVAEAGVESMASKAGRLKQKALSVVDSVQTLGSHRNKAATAAPLQSR